MNWQNFKDDMKRWGWWRAVFARLMRRAEHYLGFRVNVIRVMDSNNDADTWTSLSGTRFVELDESMLREAAKDPEMDIGDEFVTKALARDDRAFGAYDGNQLVSYFWRTTSDTPHMDGVWVRVHKPYTYSYKGFTRRTWRGKHLMAAIAERSQSIYQVDGYTKRITLISLTNYPSRATGRRLLAREIGYAGYFVFFGRYLFFRTAGVRSAGFEFFVPKDGERR